MGITPMAVAAVSGSNPAALWFIQQSTLTHDPVYCLVIAPMAQFLSYPAIPNHLDAGDECLIIGLDLWLEIVCLRSKFMSWHYFQWLRK
jgi:hypothetical protein